MKTCLDSWVILAWLDGREPVLSRVNDLVDGSDERPVMSWINLVEVYCRVDRDHGRAEADDVLAKLRQAVHPDLPTTGRMIEAGRIKSENRIALADCFAAATAAAWDSALWTGDPDLIDSTALPCQVVDLREGIAR